MSELTVFALDSVDALSSSRDPDEIARQLGRIGVRFEQWPLRAVGSNDTADILAAYTPEIERLKAENGYTTVDVIAMTPDHPDRDVLRAKFLDEHRHSEDEVRFFVEGEGLFTLRTDDHVHAVRCAAGDLISVPAGMRHWFDMGPAPRFTAIRLFTNPEGWVARFTGDPIARHYPRYDAIAA